MGLWTDYTKKDTPEDNDTLMIYDAAGKANKQTLFSGFWKWVAKKLKEATLSDLQTTDKTLIGAINELNSKTLIDTENKTTFEFGISLNKNSYTTLLMYGATSKTKPFAYLVFIDVLSNSRGVVFHKIIDSSIISFSGTYSDSTSVLAITADKTVYGGLRIIAIK